MGARQLNALLSVERKMAYKNRLWAKCLTLPKASSGEERGQNCSGRLLGNSWPLRWVAIDGYTEYFRSTKACTLGARNGCSNIPLILWFLDYVSCWSEVFRRFSFLFFFSLFLFFSCFPSFILYHAVSSEFRVYTPQLDTLKSMIVLVHRKREREIATLGLCHIHARLTLSLSGIGKVAVEKRDIGNIIDLLKRLAKYTHT